MPKPLTPQNDTDEFTVHDFDQDLRDLADEALRDRVRALVFGLPERPGTQR